MKKLSVVAALAAAGLMSASTAANAFSTTSCKNCHAVGFSPSFESIVATYGDEQELARVFESGFAVKDRKIASSNEMWAQKASMMTVQYEKLIKGHGKEAAHAVFETAKNGRFDNY